MGTDIHAFWERKGPDGNWYAFEPPVDKEIDFEERNYAVFSYLFGVRGLSNLSLFPDRGIPTDSLYIKKLIKDYFHSITYSTVKELKNINWSIFKECETCYQPLNFNKTKELFYEEDISECNFRKYLDKHFSTNEFDDVRIIFAFDS